MHGNGRQIHRQLTFPVQADGMNRKLRSAGPPLRATNELEVGPIAGLVLTVLALTILLVA